MKKLIVILGSNGVGKSTTAKAFLNRYTRCAYVDSDWCRVINPFPFTPATKEAVTENIYCMIKNYLRCECDGREAERIERGIKNTFHFYDVFSYPCIITTELSPEEVAEKIADIIK